MGVEECENASDDRESSVNSVASAILFLVLFFTWFPFALRFSWKLCLYEDRNPLTWSVLAYAISSMFSLLVSLWWDIIEPVRQSRHGFSLGGCAFSDVLAWVSVLSNYILLIEILIRRLEIAFSDTVWALGTMKIRILRVINGIHWMVSFLMCLVLSSTVDCFNMVDSGIMHSLGMAKKNYRVCTIPIPPAAVGVIILSSFTTIVMMFSLAYMFVSRVRSIIIKNTMDDQSESMTLLIERSSVVGLASILTLFISVILVIATDWGFMIIFDSCLNLVLLYCLFGFGEQFYEQLFGQFAKRWLRTDSVRSIAGLPPSSQLTRGISNTNTATAASSSRSGDDMIINETVISVRTTRVNSSSSDASVGETQRLGNHDFI